MKKIINLVVTFMTLFIVICACCKNSNLNAQSPSSYGFNINNDVWKYESCKTNAVAYAKVTGSDKYKVGKVTTDAFFYKLRGQENDEYDYFLVAYKLTVTPMVSEKKYHWFFNYYGWSENLTLAVDYSNNDRITNYSPVTENPKSTYSVGVKVGTDNSAFSASVSAQMQTTEDSLAITVNDNPYNHTLTTRFDYLCDVNHSKHYLTNQSIQYGMYITEHKKGSKFKTSMKTEVTFELANGTSSFVQLFGGPNDRELASTNATFSL